jgi:predicted transcriptional regulator
MIDKNALARLTAEVVSSYVGNSSLSDAELDRAVMKLPLLIDRVHEALLRILQGEDEVAGDASADASPPAAGEGVAARPAMVTAPPEAPARPAVPISESVHDNYLICLEDGRKYKTLKRHLQSKYGLTPDAYRAKWGLQPDYPMACKSYTASRSSVAKRIGLGVGGRGSRPAYVRAKRASAST